MLVSDSDLGLLVAEWEYHLRARNLSPATIKSYLEAAHLLDDFLVAQGVTDLDAIERRHIEKFLIQQSERLAPGTVLTRFRSLRVLFNWLVDSEEIDRSPMARMKEPRGEQRPPSVPKDEDVARLLKSINGRTFDDRRDLALLRFLFDTGTRINEAITLRVEDIDVRDGVALVYGKGRKARVVPFGAKTAAAILAYQRERRRHRYADLEQLFIGQRGPISYHAAYRIVRGRAEKVGIRLHPHQTRHWLAHVWLRDGGNEGDLRAIGGWNSENVMRRYGASAASERARAAHRQRSPGDRV